MVQNIDGMNNILGIDYYACFLQELFALYYILITNQGIVHFRLLLNFYVK